ncbi:MAG: hypothetical protein WB341_13655, partial [Terracidiphilus sp.]
MPAHRTKFSKRQFVQPQLLAVLCLMRFEDWTFREAEVRLREHTELRSALQLQAALQSPTLILPSEEAQVVCPEKSVQ